MRTRSCSPPKKKKKAVSGGGGGGGALRPSHPLRKKAVSGGGVLRPSRPLRKKAVSGGGVLRPSRPLRKVCGGAGSADVSLAKAFQRLNVKSVGMCPSYAAVRETSDGRSYVLERVNGSKPKKRFCVDRKRSLRSKSTNRAVQKQGEFILDTTFKQEDDSDNEDDLARVRRDFRNKPHKRLWLGVNTKELHCWDKSFDDYHYGLQLGKGSFGSVHEACKGESCRYVLKISFFADDFDREVAEREIAIMKQLNDSGITAKLINSKICEDKALMLMERFDMSAEQLGKQQYERFFGKGADVLKGSMMFTDRQIQQMFALAQKLSSIGVIHGDLKLDNIMYLLRQERFVAIDFGFTGTYKSFSGKMWDARWGFSHAMGCSQQTPVSSTLIPYANVWQLLLDFSTWPLVLVAIESPHSKNISEIRVLAGLGPRFKDILNPNVLQLIKQECPHPKGELFKAFKEFKPARNALLKKLRPYWV